MFTLIENSRQQLVAREARWRRIVIGLAIAVVLVQWIRIGVQTRGDFNLHWEFGRRLAAGEFIYRGSLDCPYPPFWALAHAPLSLLPRHTAQIVIFPLFLAACVGLWWSLETVCGASRRRSRTSRFWVAAAAVALASRFVVRDMLECGVNLAFVALAWLSVVCWQRRREWAGGTLLGLAVALKCTAGLFLVWYVWKRQWKMVAASTAAIAAFTLLPIFWMGPAAYSHAMHYWIGMTLRGAGNDPSHGVLGEEPLQNISLRAALGRFLIHVPEGHQARVDHPLYLDLLDLPPETAGWIAKLAMLALVVWLGWCCRGTVSDRRDPDLPRQCAVVSAALLLLSPITWGQHCVGLLPAFYVLIGGASSGERLRRWVRWVLGVYVVAILVFNRAVLGKELTYLLDSYGVTTWCILALMIAVAHGRSQVAADATLVECTSNALAAEQHRAA